MNKKSRSTSLVGICVSFALVSHAEAQKTSLPVQTTPSGGWSAVGTGIAGNYVADLIVLGSELIAAGYFSEAGGQPAHNIAAWNGASWSQLGSGVNGPVTSITVYSGQLIVAGNFTQSGGVPTNHISAWNGSVWSALETGRDQVPSTIESYDGEVFVGINTTIGTLNESIAYLDAWNGSSWRGVASFSPGVGPGSPSQAYLYALDVADGKLFIGGLLADQGAFAYNGTIVTHVGVLGDWIRTFEEFGGEVIAGGYNPLLGKWNGATSWTSLSGSWDAFCGTVYDLQVHNGLLIAAGGFAGPECPPNDYLITWDGSNWSTLGSGMDNTILSLVEYGNRLLAAGYFSTADGKPASLIAQWDDLPVSVQRMSFALHLAQNYPNPFNPTTTISFHLPARQRVAIHIFDVHGNLQRRLLDATLPAGQNSVTWDGKDVEGRSLHSGVYFYRLGAGGRSLTRKMVLLK